METQYCQKVRKGTTIILIYKNLSKEKTDEIILGLISRLPLIKLG
jgi:hypothetical protein